MKTLVSRIVRSVRDTRAATMAEYAILVAVIALVVIVGARTLGSTVSGKLNGAATTIQTG